MPSQAGIEIECSPHHGKWMAQAYYNWEEVTAYGKTADRAIERVKAKLCKLIAKEERKAKREADWRAEFKYATFDRNKDCSG